MKHVVLSMADEAYGGYLFNYHRLRFESLTPEQQSEAHAPFRLLIDACDHARARYYLMIEEGSVVAGARFTPASLGRPVEGLPIVDDTVWDVSAAVIRPKESAVRDAVRSALLEGLRAFIADQHMEPVTVFLTQTQFKIYQIEQGLDPELVSVSEFEDEDAGPSVLLAGPVEGSSKPSSEWQDWKKMSVPESPSEFRADQIRQIQRFAATMTQKADVQEIVRIVELMRLGRLGASDGAHMDFLASEAENAHFSSQFARVSAAD